ncbi:MAG: DNA repair protein RecN [Methylococcales bacterium]|jgi:DNA repair protein RecN (Recombination protein N)
MLQNIKIMDLAVVESLDLNLDHGMSVLTGETGAGKSILLTALGLALGDRADSDYIRPGSKRAEINLEFDLTDALVAQKWLKENDLDDDQHCLIRRIISHEGPSKSYINNRPVTLQLLQQLSKNLVEIHGQHAHLKLLQPEEQRGLLDAFANTSALVNDIASLHQQWQTTNNKINNQLSDQQHFSERTELLQFQLHELQQLDLEHFDYEKINSEHGRLANIEQILSTGQEQLHNLFENEQQSAIAIINQSLTKLSPLLDIAPELEDITILLTDAQLQVSEASQSLNRFLEAQEIDPQKLLDLEEQLGLIHTLCRKHAISPEEIPLKAEQLSTELNTLIENDNQIEHLNTALNDLESHYHLLADNLTEQRQKGAIELQAIITSIIKNLGMDHGEFMIECTPLPTHTLSAHGKENITFLISANPGLPAKSITKIASGGELSRISLAIQVATSHDKTIPTMIFDEVDSGIGGGVAEIVGQRLRQLGEKRQVICVTHLPQVASQSHHHLFVSKEHSIDVTASSITALTTAQRIKEIARMLGGVTITEQTLAHAEEMLQGNS